MTEDDAKTLFVSVEAYMALGLGILPHLSYDDERRTEVLDGLMALFNGSTF